MRLKSILTAILISGLAVIFIHVAPVYAQQQEKVSVRTLPVDWYMYSGAGVKLQYRNFNNDPVILYLPASFENKLYRFVEAPPSSGSRQGLPVLLVHMKGNRVVFIDIYTQFQRKKGLIADFSEDDLKKFKEAESKGSIEIKFQ